MLGNKQLLAWGGLCLALLLVAGGAWSLVGQYQTMNNAVETRGTVVTAEYESNNVNTNPAIFDATGTAPKITYRYTVDETTYQSRTLRPAGSQFYTMIPQQATAFINSHKEGTSVTVLYPPDAPEQSYLVSQYAFVPSYLSIIIGFLLIGDVMTKGSSFAFLVRLYRITPRPSTTIENTNIKENKNNKTRENSQKQDVRIWIGIIVASEALVLHYYLFSKGPNTIVAPLTAVVLLVILGVIANHRHNRQPHTL